MRDNIKSNLDLYLPVVLNAVVTASKIRKHPVKLQQDAERAPTIALLSASALVLFQEAANSWIRSANTQESREAQKQLEQISLAGIIIPAAGAALARRQAAKMIIGGRNVLSGKRTLAYVGVVTLVDLSAAVIAHYYQERKAQEKQTTKGSEKSL